MKKEDIINEISMHSKISTQVIREVVDMTIDVLKKSICKGETISLRGLFSISNVLKKERKCYSVSKHDFMTTPKHYTPKVKFSKDIITSVTQRNVE